MNLPDLTGQRVIVTGANTGLGYASTVALAGAGAEVVLAVRDQAKGVAAMQRMHDQQPTARLEVAHLDLADLSSVARFAQEQVARGPLDLLINNAGLMLVPERQLTRDRFELQMGVNHLGHYALTAQLMRALGQGKRARVISLSSLAHRMTSHLDPRLGTAGPYAAMNNYAQSKLACALFGFELDRRLKAAGSTILSVVAHPGYVVTELFTRQANPSLADRLTSVVTPMVGSRPEHGALSQLRAATDPDLLGGEFIGPRFLIRGRPTRQPAGPNAVDRGAAELLWDLSASLTRVAFDLDAAQG